MSAHEQRIHKVAQRTERHFVPDFIQHPRAATNLRKGVSVIPLPAWHL